MKRQDIVLLLVLGFVIWLVGTIYYAFRGAEILETSRVRYLSAFALSSIVSGLLCIGILRWRQIAPANWTTAALLLALPGMAGEVIVLSNLSIFMPKLHASSGGKYGAFLFAAYALVLAVAEVVTLRATP
ncbi:MAG TPA: DUF5367 family protein [Granulicella sp.]|jgi:hypothetical protein